MVFNGNPANYLLRGSKPKQNKVEQSETNESCVTNTVTKTKILIATFLLRYKGCLCHNHRRRYSPFPIPSINLLLLLLLLRLYPCNDFKRCVYPRLLGPFS